jgi:hypothetical protein
MLCLVGCVLFLCSTVFPFLLEYRGTEFWFATDIVSYWSFKSSTQREALGEPSGPVAELWFGDYWVKMSAYGVGYLPAFVSMFAAQVLTLIAGAFFVFIRRRFLAIVSTVLSSTVVALMTYVNVSFKQEMWSHDTQIGYWLAFPSFFVFLFVSILSFVWIKGKNEGNIKTV